MALRFELLKSFIVAASVLLHTLGYSPLPVGSIVALCVIQSFSLLGCALEFRTAPAQQKAKLSSAEIDVMSIKMGHFASSAHTHIKVLISVASLKFKIWTKLAKAMAWSALAILLAKAVHAAALDDYPLAVLFVACSLGALCQLAAAKGQLCECTSGRSDICWLSTTQGDEDCQMPSESPLAIMAKDLFPVPLSMDSPLFDPMDSLLFDISTSSRAVPMEHEAKFCSMEIAGTQAGVLTGKASVRVMALFVMAVIVAKVLRIARPGGAPFEMLLLAGHFGALCQLAAGALGRSASIGVVSAHPFEDDALNRDLEEVFPRWQVDVSGGPKQKEAESDSPLANIAEGIFATAISMQSPVFEVEA